MLRYFQRLDKSIGHILSRVDDDTLVIVMSDHGMGPTHNWLLEVGLLRLKDNLSTWFKRRMFEAGCTPSIALV